MLVQVPAYAKINLGLKVLGKRPDGYHEVCTILQQIDLSDSLTFEVGQSRGEVELECDGADVPADGRNLVLQAARKLAELRPDSVKATRIKLLKRIPIGGGLGGGSSDAAVTLAVLNELWRLGLSPSELHRIAREVGADVPFFLYGGTALGTGIGDELEQVQMWEEPTGLLLTPEVQVSTAWAYNQLKSSLTKIDECDKFRSFLRLRPPLPEWDTWLENDFEAVVFASFPRLVVLRGKLVEAGANVALMSGSGSCLFGLFPSGEDALGAASRFSDQVATQIFRFCRWGLSEIQSTLRPVRD